MVTTLFYVHDPMCSWCWAFRRVWNEVQAQLPSTIKVHKLVGGLAPDSARDMPSELQKKLQDTWRHIQSVVPGTEFNFNFWTECHPRRSTYPACRAVIAAKNQGDNFEDLMIHAIQEAYYLQARNPSDDHVLIELARSIELEVSQFSMDLNSLATQTELRRQIQQHQQLGAQGFPSLIVSNEHTTRFVQHDYNNSEVTIQRIMENL